MKTKITVCCACIAVMISIGVLTVKQVQRSKTAMSQSVDTESEETFIIKSNNGKLAVYSNSGELISQTDFNVNSLPEKDIEILNKGLTVQGISGVRSAIEDYTS